MTTYAISSNLCKKVLCNVVAFTIFHLSEAVTGSVLLEKVFLEISQIRRKIPVANYLLK